MRELKVTGWKMRTKSTYEKEFEKDWTFYSEWSHLIDYLRDSGYSTDKVEIHKTELKENE